MLTNVTRRLPASALWPPLALLALTLLFYFRLAFTNLILARGDTFAYFYPYWAARSAALAEGRLPLWTPDLFMGAPLLANSQIGTFYPPNWLVTSLPPPDAVRISLLIHVFGALLGMYVLARRVTTPVQSKGWMRALPALLAAVLFGLGGFVGARVEQINQLQGIAWMPWLFWLYLRALDRPAQGIATLAMGIALQFLTGHTQTVFITMTGLGFLGVMGGTARGLLPLRAAGRALVILGLAALLALPLMSPQLIPTLELMSVSNRSAGLNPNQATAFSLNPFVIGRGLLPSYDGLVFTEFVAYPGVIGLGLAVIGILSRLPGPAHLATHRAWIALAAVGIMLALGEFNPLYWLLAALPGFNLFRVPARWLALFALACAVLAGTGLRQLLETSYRPNGRILAALAIITAGLALSSLLSGRAPESVIGPAEPTLITWAGWGAALVALLGVLAIHGRLRARSAALLAAAAAVELFAAALALPYNQPVTPDTYYAQRFSISQLLAYQRQQAAPGRVLSISSLLFDPGDRAALEARYQRYGLSELGIRLGLVDTKMKETISANLPLIWNIPTIDGFDGGLLPTRFYTAFTSLMIPPGELRTIDGRLREILAREACRGACIPDQRWLDLTHTRYLITDKIYDLWYADVAYDTQIPLTMQRGDTLVLDDLPSFEANALNFVYECLDDGCPVPAVEIAEQAIPISDYPKPAPIDHFQLQQMRLAQPATLSQLVIQSSAHIAIYALTLVDTRTGDFAQAALGPWRRRLSSDIKLYENKQAVERAFVVSSAHYVPDTDLGTEAALDIMRDPGFDPRQTAVLSDTALAPRPETAPGRGTARITLYSPERIEISARADGDSFLVLADAFYPGWTAQVNSRSVPVYRADVMFRAVSIPAGESRIVFTYQPAWLPWSIILGIFAWLFVLAGAVVFARRSRI